MLNHPATAYLHNNPNAYWCADCWRWTLDCAHLVEPLNSPEMKLEHWQYLAVTWHKNVLQVTMNTEFVRNPGEALLKGYRFERVKGRA